jgi:bifunctional enzyme CysN/CysC
MTMDSAAGIGAETLDADYWGATVWLTGLPAAGKTTIGRAAYELLRVMGRAAYRLDGDELRTGLTSDLGFDQASRAENIRRAAYAARMLAESGVNVVASLISPYAADRALARQVHGEYGLGFVEVFLDTPLAECERRDPKGLYARARRGEVEHVTGIDDPYEPPTAADLVLYPAQDAIATCARQVIDTLIARGTLAFARRNVA